MDPEPNALVVTVFRAFAEHLDHALAFVLLIARVADIASTRLATPSLTLEANPVVRKLGWPFAWATLPVCFVAYLPGYGPAVAVLAIVISLLVAGSNFSRGWAARALGESEARAHLLRVFSVARPSYVYLSIATGSVLVGALGGLMLIFYPSPTEWAHYFAIGIVLYALAMWLYPSLAARRLFREAASSRTAG